MASDDFIAEAISYTVGFRQSKTALFDWNLLVLLPPYRRFYSFCVLPRGGWFEGVLRYSSRNRLAAPHAFSASNGSSQRVGGFGLSQKPPKLRSWSCTQPRAAKATAGAAVVGSMGSIPRAAAVV